MSWFSGFEHVCRADVPLRDMTWVKLGGPAGWLVEPRDEPECCALLARCRDAGLPWRMLGAGANILVPDEGYRGAVFRLRGENFEEVEYDGNRVSVGAGVELPRLVRETIQRGLVGLESLAGIPGVMGGVIRMNAGGKYGEIASFVREVSLIEPDGELTRRSASDIAFSYRSSNLAGCVILGASLELPSGDAQAAWQRHKEIWNEKYGAQPPVAARSAGCIFKNPAGQKAGRLLDQCGLKGTRIGAAEISEKHANFIVAYPGASARDVIDLIRLAKDRVWNETGVVLELEVDIWDENKP